MKKLRDSKIVYKKPKGSNVVLVSLGQIEIMMRKVTFGKNSSYLRDLKRELFR